MKKTLNRSFLLRVLLVAVVALLALPVFTGTAAAKFPEREITIMVPYSPGGATDLMFRALGPGLEKALGVPIVFTNKPGGGGSVGWAWLARQKPDGYTTGAFSISLILQQYTGVAGIKIDQFTYFAHVGAVYDAIAVPQSSPFKTLKDLVTFAKDNPGIITVSNSGTGSLHHLCAAGLAAEAGVKFTHVPFGGGKPAVVAMVGGHVSASSSTIGEVYEFAKAGKARVLGITSEKRYELAPDVPTEKEQGYDFVFGGRNGLIGPKGVPADVVKILSDACGKAATGEDYINTMNKVLMPHWYMDSKSYTDWVYEAAPKVQKLLKEVGLIK